MVTIHILHGAILIITIIILILMATIHTILIMGMVVDITEMAAEVFIATIITAHQIRVFTMEVIFQEDPILLDTEQRIHTIITYQVQESLEILEIIR